MSNQELLAKIGQSTEETEFYTPMPPGYRKGKHKYVVVVGTVMSGLGKGIFSSSLAKLLQDKGLKVAPIKMEGYLNIDSGTLNPYRHGDVFVALTYILEPGALGEQKSKAAQLGIKRLMEVGIMPHIIACRAAHPIKDKVKEKISMYTNVPMRRVVSMHDVESIYTIPEHL